MEIKRSGNLLWTVLFHVSGLNSTESNFRKYHFSNGYSRKSLIKVFCGNLKIFIKLFATIVRK